MPRDGHRDHWHRRLGWPSTPAHQLQRGADPASQLGLIDSVHICRVNHRADKRNRRRTWTRTNGPGFLEIEEDGTLALKWRDGEGDTQWLGPAEAAMDRLANFLAAQDFGER